MAGEPHAAGLRHAPTLDPRNAYDWLVLYSLNRGAGQDEAMGERMESVISALFPQEETD